MNQDENWHLISFRQANLVDWTQRRIVFSFDLWSRDRGNGAHDGSDNTEKKWLTFLSQITNIWSNMDPWDDLVELQFLSAFFLLTESPQILLGLKNTSSPIWLPIHDGSWPLLKLLTYCLDQPPASGKMTLCDAKHKNKKSTNNPNPKQNKKKTLVDNNSGRVTTCLEKHHKMCDFSLIKLTPS